MVFSAGEDGTALEGLGTDREGEEARVEVVEEGTGALDSLSINVEEVVGSSTTEVEVAGSSTVEVEGVGSSTVEVEVVSTVTYLVVEVDCSASGQVAVTKTVVLLNEANLEEVVAAEIDKVLPQLLPWPLLPGPMPLRMPGMALHWE